MWGTEDGLRFEWTKVETAESYIFHFNESAGRQQPYQHIETQSNTVVLGWNHITLFQKYQSYVEAIILDGPCFSMKCFFSPLDYFGM